MKDENMIKAQEIINRANNHCGIQIPQILFPNFDK